MRSKVSIVTVITAIAALAIPVLQISCGGGGGGGGSTATRGVITGFGSVYVNGVEFTTGSDTHRMLLDTGEDHTGGHDSDVLRTGMVVTVHHEEGDHHATEIEYEDDLEGPVQFLNAVDNTFEVLGQKVAWDTGTTVEFQGNFATAIDNGDIVEVSGLTDSTRVIHATYIEVSPPGSKSEFEIKGYVSELSINDNTFRLGPLPLPDMGTVTVDFSSARFDDLPGGVADGKFVEVETVSPASGRFDEAVITATEVEGKEDIGHDDDHYEDHVED